MVRRFAHVRLASLPAPSARRASLLRASLLTFALLFHQPARSCSRCVRAHRPCVPTPSGVCERCVRLQKRGRLTRPCDRAEVVAKLSQPACSARPSVTPARPGLAPLFVSVAPPHDGGTNKCSSSCLPQVPPPPLCPLGSDAHHPGGGQWDESLPRIHQIARSITFSPPQRPPKPTHTFMVSSRCIASREGACGVWCCSIF